MERLEESLSQLNASVGMLGSRVRAEEASVAADVAAGERLEDARRSVSAAVLGLCREDADASDEAASVPPEMADELEGALRASGVGWTDGFLGAEAARSVRREILDLDAETAFEPGELAGGRAGGDERFVREAVRADRCRFQAALPPALDALVARCDALVASLAERGLDCVPTDRLRHRGDPQLAVYEPVCAGYATHVDNPNRNGRRLTAVYYANEACSGGELACFRADGSRVVSLAPQNDRLVLFASERIPHEVKPTVGGSPRVAATVWYCDYDETLEAAAAPRRREDGPRAGARAAVAAVTARRREARRGGPA